MKKSQVRIAFCFSLLVAGFMFAEPAFAYKTGDCLGGDELMKDGLWKPSKKCGGKVTAAARKGSADALAGAKKPTLGASGASTPAR